LLAAKCVLSVDGPVPSRRWALLDICPSALVVMEMAPPVATLFSPQSDVAVTNTFAAGPLICVPGWT